MNFIRLLLRLIAALATFLVITIGASLFGGELIGWASGQFPPMLDYPSTDPHGRGITDAADVIGIGPFIIVLIGAVGAWLAWLWTDRRNWSVDLFAASPAFIIFAPITAANYTYEDMVFTRDAQAVLNILLVASGATVVMILQQSLRRAKSTLLIIGGSCVLAFCIYGFIAIPLWYSISFLSWKQGAGELNSLDAAAKAIAAAASLLAVAGLLWKDGQLKLNR